MYEYTLNFERMEQAIGLFGNFDENMRIIENEYGVSVVNRGNSMKICGEPEKVSLAAKAVEGLVMLLNKGEQLNEQNVRYCISLVNEGADVRLHMYHNERETGKAQNARTKEIC